VRTLFAITRDFNFPREIPRGISGYTTTLSRLFRGSQRLFASNSGNFRANSAPFVTDSRGHRYRPLSRLFRPAGPPFAPAFPRPPPAASRCPPAWPYDLAGILAGRSGQGRGTVEGRTCTYTERAPQEKQIHVIICLARRFLLFYELCAYISLGVHAEVYRGYCLRIPRVRGFRCRQVYGMEYGIAGGAEWRPGPAFPRRVSAPARACGWCWPLPGGRAGRARSRCGDRSVAAGAGSSRLGAARQGHVPRAGSPAASLMLSRDAELSSGSRP
jgi:hypothetical protein